VSGGYELVDVSMWMDAFTFPGDEPVEARGPMNVLEGTNPEYVYDLAMPSQAGTHVQGPHYFLEHGARIDAFPLDRFEGRAHLVDVAGRGVDTEPEELAAALGERDVAGEIVLLRTGHMDEVIESGRLDPADRPGLSLDAARYLGEERRIGMVAIDSIGVESRRTSNYEVNVYLCEREVLILEGLVNLAALGGGELWLEAFPLKLRGVEGTPCRAVVKQGAARTGR
jgi:arylformamidase